MHHRHDNHTYYINNYLDCVLLINTNINKKANKLKLCTKIYFIFNVQNQEQIIFFSLIWTGKTLLHYMI